MDCFNEIDWMILLDSLIEKAVPGLLSLLGVIVGARLSFRFSKRQTQKKQLREYYAELFTAYMKFVEKRSPQNLMPLLAACEKTRLLCSVRSETVIEALEDAVARDEPNAKECGKLIAKLQHCAKDDAADRNFLLGFARTILLVISKKVHAFAQYFQKKFCTFIQYIKKKLKK